MNTCSLDSTVYWYRHVRSVDSVLTLLHCAVVLARAGSIVCPFATATGMFDGIGFPWWSRLFLPILSPEYVAGQVVGAIVGQRSLVIMPWLLRWLPFLLRALLPGVLCLDWCANMLGATTAMDSFQGHTKGHTLGNSGPAGNDSNGVAGGDGASRSRRPSSSRSPSPSPPQQLARRARQPLR